MKLIIKKILYINIGKRISTGIFMGTTQIVSENYFKYDQSDYAKSLRTIYGEDGYKKYSAKMNSILAKDDENLTNPIKISKQKHIQAKKIAYENAVAQKNKAENIWNNYKRSYYANLDTARKSNNGVLTGELTRAALANCGNGAEAAYRNFNTANSNADEALSLYFDATHSGLAVNMMS